MKIAEMRKLKVGDTIVDMEQTLRFNKTVLCKIYRVDEESGIAVRNIDKEFVLAFPHKFHYKYDADKISLPDNEKEKQ